MAGFCERSQRGISKLGGAGGAMTGLVVAAALAPVRKMQGLFLRSSRCTPGDWVSSTQSGCEAIFGTVTSGRRVPGAVIG